jgi:thiamine biosynthesis protein ThiC
MINVAKIASHSADLAKGIKEAESRDYKISKDRAKLD